MTEILQENEKPEVTISSDQYTYVLWNKEFEVLFSDSGIKIKEANGVRSMVDQNGVEIDPSNSEIDTEYFLTAYECMKEAVYGPFPVGSEPYVVSESEKNIIFGKKVNKMLEVDKGYQKAKEYGNALLASKKDSESPTHVPVSSSSTVAAMETCRGTVDDSQYGSSPQACRSSLQSEMKVMDALLSQGIQVDET